MAFIAWAAILMTSYLKMPKGDKVAPFRFGFSIQNTYKNNQKNFMCTTIPPNAINVRLSAAL